MEWGAVNGDEKKEDNTLSKHTHVVFSKHKSNKHDQFNAPNTACTIPKCVQACLIRISPSLPLLRKHHGIC